MSPSPSAPSMASVRACSATSASEWPESPASCGIVTPPRITWSPGAKAWTSKPEAGAHVATRQEFGASAAQSFVGELVGGGQLHVAALALKQGDAPTRPGEQGAIVREIVPSFLRCARMGGVKFCEAEGLRRLKRAEPGAVERLAARAVVQDGADRVDDWHDRDGRARIDRGVDRARNEVRRSRTAAPRRAPARDQACLARAPRVRRGPRPAGSRRRRSGGASLGCRARSPRARLVRRALVPADDDLNAVDAGMVEKRLGGEREHRPARHLAELLRRACRPPARLRRRRRPMRPSRDLPAWRMVKRSGIADLGGMSLRVLAEPRPAVARPIKDCASR